MSERRFRKTRVERNHYLRTHPKTRYGLLGIVVLLAIVSLNFKIIPNINTYISSNHFTQAKISKLNYQTNLKYRQGRPEGVVIHSSSKNLTQQLQRVQKDKKISFNAVVDQNQVVQLSKNATTGAGEAANRRYLQVDLCEVDDVENFAKEVNTAAIYVAGLLHEYNLKPSRVTITQKNWSNARKDLAKEDAAKNKPGGLGTIWSHSEVSQYLGNTNQTDPDDYFAKYGYDMGQFYELVNQYYYGRQVKVHAGITDLNLIIEVLRWLVIILSIIATIWLLLLPGKFWG